MAQYDWQIMLVAALITTVIWVIVTFMTKPTEWNVLYKFYSKVQPGGPGWSKVINKAKSEGVDVESEDGGWDMPVGILCTLFASAAVYTALFAMGGWIYGQTTTAWINTAICVASFVIVSQLWKKLKIR